MVSGTKTATKTELINATEKYQSFHLAVKTRSILRPSWQLCLFVFGREKTKRFIYLVAELATLLTCGVDEEDAVKTYEDFDVGEQLDDEESVSQIEGGSDGAERIAVPECLDSCDTWKHVV